MNYWKELENKLEFNQIKTCIYNYCLSTMGQAHADAIKFSNDPDTIQQLLHQNNEFKTIIEEGSYFPSSHYIDISPYLDQAITPGTFLEPEALLDLRNCMATINECLRFLKDNKTRFPHLFALTHEVTIGRQLLKSIDGIIDEKANVKDNASSNLKETRAVIRKEKAALRDKIQTILQKNKEKGYTESDAEVTIRGGRLVIPVWAEYKRKLKGFIHDESATGQTAFIEPEEVLGSNNKIKALSHEEQREITRILTRLTDLLRPNIPALRNALAFLGEIDLIRAKAMLASSLDARLPGMENRAVIAMQKAVHPLLYLHHKKLNKDTVPLDLHLNEQNSILLISGPNAGGKSVCLKTAGLLQYMLQCGLMVPAHEASVFGIFNNIFIDIGDEQSIENDLSTYSSHLAKMKEMVEKANTSDLILIDELGTGTDPVYGGAIGEAVLEYLNDKKVYGIVTSHYSNMKHFASNTPGIINGAMLYDDEKLEPLFQLSIGNPGSSFAFEIAEKTGLPTQIIEKAKNKVGEKQINIDKLLQQVEKDKQQLENKQQEVEKIRKNLKKTASEYEDLKKFTEKRNQEIINKAKAEARLLIKDTNKKIEKALKAVKEPEAKDTQKEALHQQKAELDELKTEIAPEPQKTASSAKNTVQNAPLRKGDYVELEDQPGVMKILNLYEKEAEVAWGEFKSIVKRKRLRKALKQEDQTRSPEKQSSHKGQFQLHHKGANFSTTLNIRGKRVEEALQALQPFIDNAIMLGEKQLYIIHGKGNGILREAVRNHLKAYPQVEAMKDEHVEQGGTGVTIVQLK